jgi:15-cis-phytoene synthase
MNQAEQITKKSRSNLALTFFSLPKERRADITTFYAFCREVDDIADEPGVPLEVRRAQLACWRTSIRYKEKDESLLAPDIRRIVEKYRIDVALLDDILDGVETDFTPIRFEAFEELNRYCYRVASAVGLISIEIFGYINPVCKKYAYSLGIALQLTNIIRDIGVDLNNGGRIYLPIRELNEFSYSEEALRNGTYNEAFIALMNFQVQRAKSFYAEAERLLPAEDGRSMVAAELMRHIYFSLLGKIEKDRFQVFDRKYRLSRVEKFLIIARALASNLFART